MARTHQIRRRVPRYATVALVIAFTLVASACGSGEVTTDTTGSAALPDVAVDTPTTGTVGPPEPPEGDAAVALEWTEAGLSGETFIDQLIATDQGFVAYRTFQDPQAWVSEDGIDWTQKDLVFEEPIEDLYLSSITPGGPGFVAIGHTFDEDNLLLTSEDGFTWSHQDLDLEYPPLGEFAFVGLEEVVGGSEGGLVLVGRMDPSDDGPDEHRFVVWTSDDGSVWDLVEDPFGSGAYIGEILPTGDGFVTQGFIDGPGGGEYIWLSTDGRAWDQMALDFLDAGYLAGPGLVRWGDKILSAVQTEDGIRLWTSTDGRTWEQLPASPLLAGTDQFNIMVTEVAAGPLGIVLVGSLQPPERPEPPLVIEKDDLIVTFDLEAFRVIVTDGSTGDVLLEAELLDPDTTVINEDDSITLLHPDTGEALATVTPEEAEEARAKAYQEAGIDPDEFRESQFTPVLWFSPDGQRWTSMEIEEMVGSDEFPMGVVVGNDAVIVRWAVFSSLEGEGEFEEFEEEIEQLPDVLWVGRLADGR